MKTTVIAALLIACLNAGATPAGTTRVNDNSPKSKIFRENAIPQPPWGESGFNRVRTLTGGLWSRSSVPSASFERKAHAEIMQDKKDAHGAAAHSASFERKAQGQIVQDKRKEELGGMTPPASALEPHQGNEPAILHSPVGHAGHQAAKRYEDAFYKRHLTGDLTQDERWVRNMAQRAYQDEQLRRSKEQERPNKGEQAVEMSGHGGLQSAESHMQAIPFQSSHAVPAGATPSDDEAIIREMRHQAGGQGGAVVPFVGGHQSSHAHAIPHSAENTDRAVVLHKGNQAAAAPHSAEGLSRRARKRRARKARQAAAAGNYVDKAFKGEPSQYAEWLDKMGPALPKAPQHPKNQPIRPAIPFKPAHAEPAGASQFSPSAAEATVRQVMRESAGEHQAAAVAHNETIHPVVPYKKYEGHVVPFGQVVPYEKVDGQVVLHKTGKPITPESSVVIEEIPDDKKPPVIGSVKSKKDDQQSRAVAIASKSAKKGNLEHDQKAVAVSIDSKAVKKEKVELGMLEKIFAAIESLKKNMLLRCTNIFKAHHHFKKIRHHESHHHHERRQHHHYRKHRFGTIMMQAPQPVMMMQQPQPIVMQQPTMMTVQQPAMMAVQQPAMMTVQQPTMMSVQQPCVTSVQQPCIPICPPTEQEKEEADC